MNYQTQKEVLMEVYLEVKSMITKEEFCKFIESYQEFQDEIDKFDMAITGKNYSTILFETKWYSAVGKMLDAFLDSYFTEEGVDWICYYLFEDIEDKIVTVEYEDLFGTKEMEFHLNSVNELWNFLIIDKEVYFKNV